MLAWMLTHLLKEHHGRAHHLRGRPGRHRPRAGAKPTSFSLGGKRYSLHLSDKNLEAFYDLLKPYTDAADVAYDHAPVKRAQTKAAKDEPKHIRRWAEKNGIQHNGKRVTVNDRGRVAQDLRDAWVAAGSPIEEED